MTTFRYRCRTCNAWHEGMPSLGSDSPLYYYGLSEADRRDRCQLTSDTCVVDNSYFFVRGCLEIAVEGLTEPFIWGVWASISRPSFEQYMAIYDRDDRALMGPYFGWLSNALPVYPDTENLKVNVRLCKPGVRPRIEVQTTDHPLAIEQRSGISQDRLAEIYAICLH